LALPRDTSLPFSQTSAWALRGSAVKSWLPGIRRLLLGLGPGEQRDQHGIGMEFRD
jgi:hypothetical protein